jgi:hypothetical protein
MKKLEDLDDQKQCRAEKPVPFKEVVDLMKRVRRESKEDASDTIIKFAEKMRFAGESSDRGGDESHSHADAGPWRWGKRTGYGREYGWRRLVRRTSLCNPSSPTHHGRWTSDIR